MKSYKRQIVFFLNSVSLKTGTEIKTFRFKVDNTAEKKMEVIYINRIGIAVAV